MFSRSNLNFFKRLHNLQQKRFSLSQQGHIQDIKVSNSSHCPLCFQTSDPAQHFKRQDSQTAAHTQSYRQIGIQSRASHSHANGSLSISSSTAHQTQTQSLPQHSPQGQAQSHASDGGVPPGLANTLEHIIGQLDILTQVSRSSPGLS